MDRSVAVGLAGLLVLTSCAGVVGTQHEREPEVLGADDLPQPEEEGPPPEFWENPIGSGVPVETPEQAQLIYVPSVPDRLGGPRRIVATRFGSDHPDYKTADNPARRIAWVFDHQQYNRFVVIENAESIEAIDSYIQSSASETPGCVERTRGPGEFNEGGTVIECVYGERSLVTLENGETALLEKHDTVTRIIWVEPIRAKGPDARARIEEYFEGTPGLVVEVVGPAPDFTAEEAIAVANRI